MGTNKSLNRSTVHTRLTLKVWIKEGNDETRTAETAEADILPSYRTVGSRCVPPLGIGKSGASR